MKCFSKVTNEMFYGLNGEKEKSILKYVNDNKVMLMMHHLFILTNFRNQATISIDLLIEECGYKVGKKNQASFKEILTKLKELELIDFEGEIKSYSKIIRIDTTNLKLDGKYFEIEDDEIELISAYTKDIRETLNVMKVYFYLKARIPKGKEVAKNGGEPNATYDSYKTISEYTMISESNIKKYIDILQEIDLIRYKNLGYKYKEENRKIKTDCSNTYVLTRVSKDMIEEDLKEGLKKQKYFYEENGYKITSKGYKNNDKKENGLYGSLIKKEKNNTLTEKEKIKLQDIRIKKESVEAENGL